jgi:hypothetical protein
MSNNIAQNLWAHVGAAGYAIIQRPAETYLHVVWQHGIKTVFLDALYSACPGKNVNEMETSFRFMAQTSADNY